MMLEPKVVGPPLVTCVRCGRQKHPIGRDPGVIMDYCEHECVGHNQAPQPHWLWPGEEEEVV